MTKFLSTGTRLLLRALAGGVALATMGLAVGAETATLTRTESDAARTVRAWTASDYANATAMAKVVSYVPQNVFDLNAAAQERMVAGEQRTEQGRPGTADPAGLAVTLYKAAVAATAPQDPTVVPSAVGAANLKFTTSRVASFSPDERVWPRSAIGKLFFSNGTSNFVCSAALIKPGVVLTAGHCVHSGKGAGNGWYTSFQFVPAYRVGAAPFGVWRNWARVTTSSSWFSGGGGVPNPRDWALITFGKDTLGKRIGDYTGWLGFQINSMIGQQVSVIGYPANLDNGQVMHRIDSMATSYGSLNNGAWGSDMRGGSSGGPVIKNFGMTFLRTTPSALDSSPNVVVSTVSFGRVSTADHLQGGSQLDSVFQTTMNSTCTANPSAC